MLDRISLILVVIGAINWGSIGLFKFDIVAWICGGQGAILSRIIYTVVALAGIWCLSLLFVKTKFWKSITGSNKIAFCFSEGKKPCILAELCIRPSIQGFS